MGKKKILFVCVENSCRSQMAEGFAKHFGSGIVEAYSAGSRPSGVINPDAVKAMQEIGVDISTQKSKGFEGLKGVDFDYVITMGCLDVCPFVPAKYHIDWQVDDPKGKKFDCFRKVRDDIKARVLGLIRELQKR